MTTPATQSGAVAVQYSLTGGDPWVTFGAATDLGTLLRARRIGIGPGRSIVARHWRLVKVGAYDWGAAKFAINSVAFWRETGTAPAVRVWPFSRDTASQQYMIVVTPGNGEIYRASQRVASVALPYVASQVPYIDRAQVLDTLLAFHPSIPPQRLQRQGAHTEWDVRAATFTNIPLYDYDGTRAGGVNEVQRLRFVDYVAGDTFNITLEGETTASIAYGASDAATAASIQSALEALPNVRTGGVTVAPTGAAEFTVTFVGGNASDDLSEMGPETLNSTKGGVYAATLTQGKPGGEPVFSAARGYPACGGFHQGRLWLGGFGSRPQTLLGSRTGEYFNFETKGARADSAIDVTLDTEEETTIRRIFPGRHLQVFTTSAEFYAPIEPITPSTVAFKMTTRRGIQPGTSVAEMEGATVFVGRGGASLYAFAFDESVQTYVAPHLGKNSAHLVDGVVDMAFRRARNPADENDLALLVRSDGDASVLSALASEEVTGFLPWNTDGRYVAGAAEQAGDVFAVVARPKIGGGEVFSFERLDTARRLDASVLLADAQTTVSGLGHLEGRTVALYVDGGDDGDAVVNGGAVTLPNASVRSVEVGLPFVSRGRTLPIVLQQDQRGGAAMRARVAELHFRLGPSAQLKAGMAGGRMWSVPLKRRGGPEGALLDTGPGENAFKGWTRLIAVPGFRADAQIEWTKTRPGPLQILEVVATVST